jgi:hypothetical protein
MISGALYHLVATYPVISFSVGLAKPKSKILSSQSSFTAMFDGFKSLKEIKFKIEGVRTLSSPLHFAELNKPKYLVMNRT